ncbi:MAG: CBS domain-containing protein [Wenzhouxiangella sp.]|nr:MAG: CBS domain-containing protein [Wenzhouxiangella sp.]
MLRSVDLSDYIHKNPAKALADDRLFDAIDLITDNRLTGVCVVTEKEELVGILSEMDCLRAVIAATYNDTADVGRVSDFMTRGVQTCQLHDNVVDVANDMVAKGHRRRPVVDENGKLIGQISCRQILRVVSMFNRRKTR